MTALKANLPVIDMSPFVSGVGNKDYIARAVAEACQHDGFFYIVGHGIDSALQNDLEEQCRVFFALPAEEKMNISMEHAGRAWRGYFPIGGELTSGKPDIKEGLYFGSELGSEHPHVRSGTPMFGANLFPQLPGFRDVVLKYIDAMTALGHSVLEAVSLSLELDARYFNEKYTSDPLILFRIFHYPRCEETTESWGVGAHTDYGLLTLLKQDDVGGLQIKRGDQWIDATPLPNTFVVNIGDMLDRISGGHYKSTLHRVLPAPRNRLSFPFFFDPNFFAKVEPIRRVFSDDALTRWDSQSVHEFSGTYGDYLLAKVSKVFPQLRARI